ncbi:hypothetical protein G7046_g2139 [Stylonectria norvegica]|nr:hypothetical protein G7046_g2139 [Stylonectria norvegica]
MANVYEASNSLFSNDLGSLKKSVYHQRPSVLLYDWFCRRNLDAGINAGHSKPSSTSLPNKTSLTRSDVDTLASKGCFDLPNQWALDQLFRHYFLHVHPLLPLVDEVQFAELHSSSSTVDLLMSGRLSLLLLYGILYTSSSYVPKSLVEAIGFTSLHHASSTFYDRAQALYHSGFEKSSVIAAQSALLLAHCYLAKDPQVLLNESIVWLRIAIKHAMDSGAHEYDKQTLTPSRKPIRLQNTLKRLWWCCVIRDRVMALAGRKDIQITRSVFDFDNCTPLNAIDLAEEVQYSSVHSTSDKRSLVDILAKFCELCTILTDVLSIFVCTSEAARYTLAQQAEHANRIRDSRYYLRQWYDSMLHLQLHSRVMDASGSTDKSQASVMLYTNILLIYYHSGNLTLCHQEMAILGVQSPSSANNYNLLEGQQDVHPIQTANCQLVHCLKQVVKSGMAHWLPLGAVACAIVPLALHIFDLKAMTITSTRFPIERDAAILQDRQSNFAQLIETMEKCRFRFVAVDWLLDCVRVSAESFHQLLRSEVSPWDCVGQQLPIRGWVKTLQKQPQFYLTLVALMDFSVRIGELPGAADLLTRWRTIGHASGDPAGALRTNDISESLSIGDIEILTNIEAHCANLYELDTNSDTQRRNASTEESSKDHEVNANEYLAACNKTKLDAMILSPASIAKNLGDPYAEAVLHLPRSWMEEISVLAV